MQAKVGGENMPKVCLDAGHYGKYNRSPGVPEYYESEVMWKLHLLQKKYLEQLGIEVITTRDNLANDLALVTRGKKSKGCDLFISNHSNATGTYTMNESVDYVVVFNLENDTTTDVDEISKKFANKIAPVVKTIMGTKQNYQIMSRKSSNDRNNDGILNDNYYGVLHGARLTKTPAVLIEHSFHTNTNTVKWLLNENNLDNLARAEAECIASFLLGKEVTLTGQTEPTKKMYYVVQTGAFENKQNAEALLKKVQAKGFKDAYITTKYV